MNFDQVLLAEDDDALRAALGEVLSRLGFRVFEAADGHTALDAARRPEFGFSILDFHMPGMNALEILRTLRSERVSPPPCILISGGATTHEQGEALRAGAFRFLNKPFPLDSLLDCVRDTLQAFHPGPQGEQLLARLRGGLGEPPDASGLPAPLDLFFRLSRPPPRGDRPC